MQTGFVDFQISLDKLIIEWYPKVQCFVRRTRLSEQDDLVQELMLHLLETSAKFRLGQSVFTTFAWTCIKNKLRTLIKQSKQVETNILGEQLSWEEIEFDLDCKRIDSLNKRQYEVFIALWKGYRKSEIAERLKITESRVSGLIREIAQKKQVQEIVVQGKA